MLSGQNKTESDIGANGVSVTHALKLIGGNVGKIALQISGTFAATIAFEATVDGTNWVACAMHPIGNTAHGADTDVTSTTAVGLWVQDAFAMKGIRARSTAYTSGTATVTILSV